MRQVLLAAGLALLVAAAPGARSGPAASGGWRGDAPGVMHRVSAADLPPPNATRSVADASRVVARPEGALPRVPPGFTVSLWATGLNQPRAIRRAPDGSIFVAESGAGRVLRFTPDGQRATFVGGLEQPFGMAFWPPVAPRYVYVAETGRVLRFPWQPGSARPAGKAEVVIPELATGGHWTRDLAVAEEGSRLFVSVGSDSNVAQGMRGMPPGGIAAWQAKHGVGAAWGEETGRAAVLWFRPDGAGGLHPFAQGLRNCSGLSVEPTTGAVWCAVNERDGLGDNLPPDYATHLTEGGFYGWPWFYIGSHPDRRTAQQRPDLAYKVVVA
ncbi:MAG: PQQ-dependent sugar dehydrogenase, partial [Acetobacteraceae bacterium]